MHDDDDPFIIDRAAYYIDQGVSIVDAVWGAEMEWFEASTAPRREHLRAELKRAKRVASGLRVVGGTDPV